MKKIFTLILSLLFIFSFVIPALADSSVIITKNPNSPTYSEGAVGFYSVTAYSTCSVSATWYMLYNGVTYNISDTGKNALWENYAGSEYGPNENHNDNVHVFNYVFSGISAELNGAVIYAILTTDTDTVKSAEAYITVIDGTTTPPTVSVPASIEANVGDIVDIFCSAQSNDGTALSYTWYETSTGKLFDIIAINRGSETGDTLRCDTSEIGTRYYVCGVATENGSAYSSIVSVTVTESDPVSAPVILTESLPSATLGENYSFTLSCSDGDATFSIYYNPGRANEFEETGLNLTQYGFLEGAPAKAGSFTFTVAAFGEGGEDYKQFTLIVTENTVTPTAPTEPDSTVPTEPDSTVPTGPEATAPNDPTLPTTMPESTFTETVPAESEPTAPNTTPNSVPETTCPSDSDSLPIWGIVLIAFACGGFGIIAGVLLFKRKK